MSNLTIKTIRRKVEVNEEVLWKLDFNENITPKSVEQDIKYMKLNIRKINVYLSVFVENITVFL